jgi:hypothetical protein
MGEGKTGVGKEQKSFSCHSIVKQGPNNLMTAKRMTREAQMTINDQ